MLSGGGALGALQAGFLRVLFRTGFRPGMIVGTSAGALNGAFLAFHPDSDGADELVRIWRDLRNQSLFLFNPLRVAFQVVSQQLCLFNSDLLRDLLARHTPRDDFAATEVPLYITVTNLTQGRKVVLHEGPISRAVLASTALPGIFCPVDIDGDLYVDGGVLANLDLRTAIELGAQDIVAMDLSRCIDGQRRPNSVAALWMQTLDVIQRERVEHEFEHLKDRARITLVQPGIESSSSLSSLAAVGRLLEEGERLGEAVVAQYMRDGRLEPGVVHEPLHIHR